MKKVPMDEIETKGLRIEGGWEAWVPEVTPDEDAIQTYSRYFQGLGRPPGAARKEALETVQKTFDSAFLRGLRLSVARWARLYHEKFGNLDGFDPSFMQGAYVPFDNTGRRGKVFAQEMLWTMKTRSRNADS